MLINQYLLALGDFHMDNFHNKPESAIIYILFVLATFVTQVTMLNMVIAIMGDTFSKVMDNIGLHATATKLALLGELSNNIFGPEKDENALFLFVAKPDDTEEDGSWEGSARQVSKEIVK